MKHMGEGNSTVLRFNKFDLKTTLSQSPFIESSYRVNKTTSVTRLLDFNQRVNICLKDFITCRA